MSSSEAVRKHRQFLFPAVSMYYQEPIALARGEGHYVWDDAGRRYLDAFGGVLTVSVGHANPKVVNAIVDALAELGVEHLEMPATPERVWRAIQAARR